MLFGNFDPIETLSHGTPPDALNTLADCLYRAGKRYG
jgi:hypothetical protein